MVLVVEKEVSPSKIMQIGLGFWASKTLLHNCQKWSKFF